MSSAEIQPDPNDVPATAPDVGEQLPVYLDDDAVESMAGETMDVGGDVDDAARLLASDVGSRKVEKSRRKGGIGWFKALFLFFFAQFLLLLILGAVFRKPLVQAYDRLVERGYVKPGSLPWQSGGVTRGEAVSSVGDVGWEDVRLRHELTLLADAAIARGDRGAIDELRGVLDVADEPVRRAAARAEIFRVQQMYATASRLSKEPLAVEQMFPGKTSEKDLDEQQIVELLTNPDRETKTRVRAAWLLRGHRTMTANDQLMIAIRNDKNLDVVKQAMLSFQKNTGYHGGDWFDANSAETWWAENASRLAKEFDRDRAGEKPAVPAVDAQNAAPPVPPKTPDAPKPFTGDADSKGKGDPPAAPAPFAEGAPIKKNLRPLPSILKKDAEPGVEPAAPSEGGN